MTAGSSETVRMVALEKYIQPAVRAGKIRFSLAVKDLIKDLEAQGFPPGNTPQICTALRKKDFLRAEGLVIEAIDGPPSKMSTTVVYRYRVISAGTQLLQETGASGVREPSPEAESPEARARRLAGKLRGLLKEELAEYGGGEAFIRWVRGYDEEDAG